VSYQPVNKVRFVTATTLFDGHDAAINIFRRMLQASGVEVIHLGHNRSGWEIVETAIEEDVQAIAVTSYQGGHMEFFRYLRDLLVERGCEHIRLFGGGGGTILPSEGAELMAYGVSRIYSPDDGRVLGLQGMVDDMLTSSDYPVGDLDGVPPGEFNTDDHRTLGRLISAAENWRDKYDELFESYAARAAEARIPVIGVTGTGGSGKSSLVDEMVRRFLLQLPQQRIAVISVDPSKRRTGGALLGDRIRMNSIPDERVYMRSMATRQPNLALSPAVTDAVNVVKVAGFDLILLETSGIGQADTEIVDYADLSVYVMTPEYGAASQLEKIDMLEFADLIAINKADKVGADDALREVRKQYRRNRTVFDGDDGALPVYQTIASDFNDPGTNRFYRALAARLSERFSAFEADSVNGMAGAPLVAVKQHVVPPARSRYLAEIVEEIGRYDRWAEEQARIAEEVYRLEAASDQPDISERRQRLMSELDPACLRALETWDQRMDRYRGDEFVFSVRGREITVPIGDESLSHLKLPKVAVPTARGWGDRLAWSLQENLPGEFPFTAGIYPFKRTEEDPTRMFAGEGPPEQTNRRFHYLAAGSKAKRLSTAFDSVTLYGEDPHERPDVYGKVGNSGVSVATLDDAKKLYSGFDLNDAATSVSMTINGPAPTILAFFLNAAIDQACEKHIIANGLEDEVEARIVDIFGNRPRPVYEGTLPAGHDGLGLMLLGVTGDQVLDPDTYQQLRSETLKRVRGTVQADILKEDQAQNTCIFSTEFSLRMMGDLQQFFIDNDVDNFYSVSISGYHMAEAGANPISQLAFTLANGFTYVEYYLSRGMAIDDFAPNFSFFFSNGIDPEYAVIGRVARRIWAKAIKYKYGGNERSQKLKYHIQTSGRSLHAQEISFNDIRTTLQALYAIYDNTNSLHTNAYDEAITTPSEDSVRRAVAIQLIINRELGLAKNENPLQGSFIIEYLTDLVEGAVLDEFERISSRGGVLGAMERQYQRTRIQEESLYYERRKESGEYPIVGVNTYLSPEGSPIETPQMLIRSTEDDKRRRLAELARYKSHNEEMSPLALHALQQSAIENDNIFHTLMETAKVATLGQVTTALYQVGGKYRRNM
jgi:methylmalonyl-CoA mutase